MRSPHRVLALAVGLICLLGLPASVLSAPGGGPASSAPSSTTAHGHRAYHQGVLNEIEGCGVGHAEVRVTEGRLELWFVDEGDRTNRAVRTPHDRIPLSILHPDRSRQEIVLVADPLRLAGEKNNDCSHFVAAVPKLTPAATFEGFGWVFFKGRMRPLRIAYPQGYLPSHQHGKHDHRASSHHDHSHEPHDGGHDHEGKADAGDTCGCSHDHSSPPGSTPAKPAASPRPARP